MLEHDPEKWVPVFGRDHAPTKNLRPALGFDGDPSRSRAGFADDAIAALANAAGAATPHAGLLDDRRHAVIMLCKSFAEGHPEIPLVIGEACGTLSMPR
jgi:hypothetical protein